MLSKEWYKTVKAAGNETRTVNYVWINREKEKELSNP
jgi:hypothetical protein